MWGTEQAMIDIKSEFEPKIEAQQRKIAELKEERTNLLDFIETEGQV